MTATGAIPEAIGPYRVLRPIARGGMAEVYEVEEPSTGEHFAVKLLLEAGTARKRFDREYEAMTRLNHPNIVRVYSYGFHELGPWMSMELLGGLTVQAYAKRIGSPGLPERNAEVVRVAHDIARALDHIHRRGLIHRDLKSDNVLVLPDGRVKLLDFGAAHIRQAMERITREGEFLGTFAYASPEQFLGREIDHRSDLYSLGVLLYRMATGRRPFWSKDTHALAKMHVQQRARPPRQLVPELPEELERIIMALLEKKPKDRPDSGAEVADALERLAGEPLYLPGTLDVSEAAGALVGREDQVRQVRVFLDEARPGSVALVLGMAGSGRQTVMDMVRKEAEKRSLEVWDVWGRAGGGVLPLVETMGSVADTVTLALPKVQAARERIQAILARGLMTKEEERHEFYRDCATLLRARIAAHGQGIALLVWNLHEMGRETMTALSLVREEVARTRGQLLFVCESDDAEGSLADQGVERLAPYEQVLLPPMSVRQVAVLVGALLHRRPPPTELARRIHAASGGLPDYINEVLAGLVKQGMLRVKGDDANRLDWASRADLRIPVSNAARRGLAEELTELPSPALRLLEALSLVGGETTLDVVAWALEREPAEIQPMVDLLDERGLLVSYVDDEGDRWLRWRHELLGETVLRDLHPCRRDVLRRRLLGILEQAPTFAAQVELILEEGHVDVAVARALQWGAAHLEANEPVTALEVLDPVVARLAEALDTPRPDVARLLLLHARCSLAVRPADPGIKRTLNEVTRIVAAEGERPDLASQLLFLRAERLRAVGEPAEATRALNTAWKVADKESAPALAAEIAQAIGLERRAAGDVAQAGAWLQRAYALAEASRDPLRTATAQTGLAAWALAQGAVGEALQRAASAMQFFDAIDDANGLSLALPVWSEALRLQGRFSEALAVLRRHLPELKAGEVPSFYVRVSLAAAWCELDLRRLGRAQEAIEELQSTMRRGEHPDLELAAELVAGRVAVESAQWETALQILPPVCEKAAAAELGSLAEHARALWGEALAAAGQRDEARQRFHEALTALQASGDTQTLAQACAARARALWAVDDPDELFRSFSGWIDEQGLEALRVEFLIAKARHAAMHAKDAGSSWAEARAALDRISRHLDETDRAVLRVHPWSRALLHEGAMA